MKRLFLALLILSSLAFGQAARYDSTAQSTSQMMGRTLVVPLPSASVTVCSFPATGGLPCTNKAQVCTDSTASSCSSSAPNNPVTADSLGNFGFYAAPGAYDFTVCPVVGACQGPYHVFLPTGWNVAANMPSLSSPLFPTFFDLALVSAPANPSAGKARVWADAGSNSLKCILAGGGSCLSGAGGGGTPGGSNQQVQFNNNGSFGGSGLFTFDGSNVSITNAIATNLTASTKATFTAIPANGFLLPSGSGYAPTTAGTFGFDTAAQQPVFGNGTTNKLLFLSGAAPTNGHCAQLSVVGTTVSVADAGAACGGGGGGGTPGGLNTQIQFNSSGSFAGSANMTFDGTNTSIANLIIPTSATFSNISANSFLLPSGAGYAPTTNAAFGYDSTALQPVYGNGTSTLKLIPLLGAGPVSGNCAKFLLSGGTIGVSDAGTTCAGGGGGGGGVFPFTLTASPALSTSNFISEVGSDGQSRSIQDIYGNITAAAFATSQPIWIATAVRGANSSTATVTFTSPIPWTGNPWVSITGCVATNGGTGYNQSAIQLVSVAGPNSATYTSTGTAGASGDSASGCQFQLLTPAYANLNSPAGSAGAFSTAGMTANDIRLGNDNSGASPVLGVSFGGAAAQQIPAVSGAVTNAHCAQFTVSGPNTFLSDSGAACGGGGGGSGTVNAGTAGQLGYYATSSTAISGNANATISNGALTLGVLNTTAGNLILNGSTSGAVTIKPGAAAAGTFNFNLPVTPGTAGQLLTSGGGGNGAMTWTPASFTLGTQSDPCTINTNCLLTLDTISNPIGNTTFTMPGGNTTLTVNGAAPASVGAGNGTPATSAWGFTNVTGGATTGAGPVTGGAGATWAPQCGGAGGSGSGAASGAGSGGAGGGCTLTAGNGGAANASGTNGNGGSVTVQLGIPGTGGTGGTTGSFVITTNGASASADIADFQSNGSTLSKVLSSGIFNGPGFTSSTANPAGSGILRLANTESICWRNNANGADVCAQKTGAASGKAPADDLDLTQFGALAVPGGTVTGTLIRSTGAAAIQFGGANAASPSAYTLTMGENGTGSNIAGSTQTIMGGKPTGTGASSMLCESGTVKVASGSTAQTQVQRYCNNIRTTITTNNSAQTIMTANVANGTCAAGLIHYNVRMSNATDAQSSSGIVPYNICANSTGTITNGTMTATTTGSALTTGTLTVTWALSGAASPVSIQVTANSSITPTAMVISWGVENLSDANDITITNN